MKASDPIRPRLSSRGLAGARSRVPVGLQVTVLEVGRGAVAKAPRLGSLAWGEGVCAQNRGVLGGADAQTPGSRPRPSLAASGRGASVSTQALLG